MYIAHIADSAGIAGIAAVAAKYTLAVPPCAVVRTGLVTQPR